MWTDLQSVSSDVRHVELSWTTEDKVKLHQTSLIVNITVEMTPYWI